MLNLLKKLFREYPTLSLSLHLLAYYRYTERKQRDLYLEINLLIFIFSQRV